jgi:hypothetical protein
VAVDAAYGEDEPEAAHLTDDEFKYLSDLLKRADVAEEDVELALALITEDEEHADRLAELVFERYPHLLKNLYSYLNNSAYSSDHLSQQIVGVRDSASAHEFTLFWTVRILLDVFEWNEEVAEVLMGLYDHVNSTDVVRAAILESEKLEFGLQGRKEGVLRNAGSSLLATSAAVGLRKLESARRNQLYKYSAASSPFMYQITRALQKE